MKQRYSALTLAVSLSLLAVPAFAQTITNGSFNSTYSTVAGTNTLNASDTRTYTGTGGDGAVLMNPGHTLVINGTLSSTDTTGGARGMRLGTAGTYNITVGANGIIQGASNDALKNNAAASQVTLVNNGQILGLNVVPNSPYTTSVGQALDFDGMTGVSTIQNNSGATIQADGTDAIRVGSNMAITNNGSIIGNSKINDNNANNNNTYNFSGNPRFDTSEAVDFRSASNSSLTNNGTVSGTRHGVDADTGATGITVTNSSTGTIIGKNGSGIGSDSTSASVTNFQVINAGLIRGDYAGSGNIVDRSGAASANNDGDGDGVDIDGGATITNQLTGIIRGTGAGGFDSLGRANGSDAISIGGGNITNFNIIEGANNGIVVNNDSVTTRSGVAATSIDNKAGASITGQNGFAIRLENKLGTAADDDTITNSGTISATGSIPNPLGTVTRQYGETDVNSNGTLDGVNYTGGTGSARFIRGDGSAIQMGEGNDVLHNSGIITSSNGRAVNLEGGADTLNVTGNVASITGGIDGGAGTDTLNFNLGSDSNTFNYAGAISNFESVKSLSGKTTLSGASTYAGTTEVGAGSFAARLNQNGTHTGGGNITVKTGGTFAGTGSETLAAVNNVLTIDNGGSLAPGTETTRGRLTLALGAVVANGTIVFSINGTAAGVAGGYDQFLLSATNAGTFSLGATSVLSLTNTITAAYGTIFTLIDFANTSSTGVTGTFSNYSDGQVFTLNTQQFRIDYHAGTNNNDVTLTAVPEPSTYAAFGLGAMGLLLVHRIRRKKY